MTRAMIAVSLVLSAVVVAWFIGGQNARDKARADTNEVTLENSETFNDAISNPNQCAWLDRLRNACPE